MDLTGRSKVADFRVQWLDFLFLFLFFILISLSFFLLFSFAIGLSYCLVILERDLYMGVVLPCLGEDIGQDLI
jgi:hypothetical protein